MSLRQGIYLRTIGLLVMLVIVCCVTITAFLVRQNRALWIDHCVSEALFEAGQCERLINWDDRVALRELLDDLIVESGHFSYAFLDKAGVPYVHTFDMGVPEKLLEYTHARFGKTNVTELVDTDGEVFYDVSARINSGGACLHLGMYRDRVDSAVMGSVRTVALIGGVMLLLCLYPAWLTARSITHEADLASEDLQKLNAELEARVEKRNEELRRANEELETEMDRRKRLEKHQSDLYAMMRHDMRNALSIIGASAEVLQGDYSERLDESAGSMLTAIRESSKTMSTMIDDLAVISRLDSEDIPLNIEELDVSDLIVEACLGISGRAADKGLTVERDIPDGLPAVHADSSYLRRAVMNVVNNAVNYTPDGGRVRIEAAYLTEGDAGSVVISISDNGPGIGPEDQERVFDMYYRAEGSAGVKGSGLGLSIVKAVMKAHQGKVELESSPGKGTTFRLFIPVRS